MKMLTNPHTNRGKRSLSEQLTRATVITLATSLIDMQMLIPILFSLELSPWFPLSFFSLICF